MDSLAKQDDAGLKAYLTLAIGINLSSDLRGNCEQHNSAEPQDATESPCVPLCVFCDHFALRELLKGSNQGLRPNPRYKTLAVSDEMKTAVYGGSR